MGARLVRALASGAPPALLAFLSACGGTGEYAVVGTDRVPSAEGLLQVERIEGGNTLLTVSLRGLPPPRRLEGAPSAYVVWIGEPGNAPRLAGRLEYDEEVRSGRMMATTPLTRFEVTITAEPDAEASAPGPVVVVQREISAE